LDVDNGPTGSDQCKMVLGLLSGLRPGTLVSLEREWVRLDDRAISIPRMKSGRSFDLPLSDHMAELVQKTLNTGEALYPGARWLFPSRSSKTGEVIATRVWREKTLPSETGHILRHTYRTIAQRLGVDHVNARLLMDHTVQGIDGVYIHEEALFDTLLGEQERMSTEIIRLLGTP
jgi:integrase